MSRHLLMILRLPTVHEPELNIFKMITCLHSMFVRYQTVISLQNTPKDLYSSQWHDTQCCVTQ